MNKRRFPAISLLVASAVLAAAATLFMLGGRPPPPGTFHGKIKNLLPIEADVPGWKREVLPIADSPEMARKVGELLNYDDGVYAVYASSTRRVSVYIAYWAPGRMSYRLVAGHTPDVCWVGAGWHIDEAQTGVRLAVGGQRVLLPAEERTMSLSGHTEYVVFWHLLDGRVKSYGTGGKPPWTAVLTDLFDRRLNQQPEQFFVRISSDQPLRDIARDELFARLADRLTMLWPKPAQ